MAKLLVDIEYTPPLAIIYLNRPEVLNAYNQSLLDIFEEKIKELLEDEKVEAIIITGKGRKPLLLVLILIGWKNWIQKEQRKFPDRASGFAI